MPTTRITVPAPYGGVNVLAGAGNTQPPEAVVLANWIPRKGYCAPRKGTTLRYAPGGGGSPRTIAPHSNGTIVIAYAGVLRGVNATTWVSISSVGGFANDYWQHTQFQQHLILCNGTNTPQDWNGAAFVPLVITGPTPSTLIGCTTFKGRVYYWAGNLRAFYYAAAGAYQGALATFDISTFSRGDGVVMFLVPITFDGGSGPDDMLAVVMSNGEVLLYQGDDPASATAWEQIGRYQIATVLGRRGFSMSGATTLVATTNGTVDLQRALSLGPVDLTATIGQQVAGVVQVDPATVTRIELHQFLNERLFLQCKFDASEYVTEVLAMDLDSRCWTLFAGWEERITAFGVINGRLLLAQDGPVITEYAEIGTDYIDGSTTGYIMSATEAYWDMGAPGARKQIGAIALRTSGSIGAGANTLVVGVVTDLSTYGLNLTTGAGGGDSVSVPVADFNGTTDTSSYVYPICAEGFEVGVVVNFTMNGVNPSALKWYGTELLVTTAGPL